MATWLKQSTAVDIAIGPFLDETDGKTAETALTITQADIRLKKNAGNWAQKNAAQTLTHEENGWYEIALDTTDTNTLGILIVAVHESGALPAWREFLVVPANMYDGLISGSGVGPRVDVQGWLGTAPSTPTVAGVPNVNAKTWNDLATVELPLVPTTAGRTLDVSAGGEAGLDWNNIGSPTTAQNLSATNIDVDQVVASVSGAVGSVTGAVGSVTGAVGSVTAGVTLAASAVQAIWDALTAALTTANSIGKRLADFITGDAFVRLGAPAGASVSADVAAVKAETASIQSDTNDIQTRLPAALVSGRMDSSVGAMAANVMTAAAAAADLTTELQSGLATAAALTVVDDFLDTEVAAIKAKTDQLTFTAATMVDANLKAINDATGGVAALDRSARSMVLGTVGAASSTTSIVTSALTPSVTVADQLNGRVVIFDKDTATAALRGQATDITASSGAGVLTVTALTTAPASGDTFVVV